LSSFRISRVLNLLNTMNCEMSLRLILFILLFK
jgi:hypothetical protein